MDTNLAQQMARSRLEATAKLCLFLPPRLSFHGSPTRQNGGFLQSLTACTSLSPHPSRHLPIPPSIQQNQGMAFCQRSPQTCLGAGSGQQGPGWDGHLPQSHGDLRGTFRGVCADWSWWNPSLSLRLGEQWWPAPAHIPPKPSYLHA